MAWMRNPRSHFAPLAVGAPYAAARDPFEAVADDPFLRSFERETARPRAGYGALGRRSAGESRGRDRGRSQGGRARRTGRGRAHCRPRRHAAVDARELFGVAVGARRLGDIGHRDRRRARRRDDPEGRRAVGHPLRGPPSGAARGARGVGSPHPRPRDPGDGAGRGQRRGDRECVAAHAGHFAGSGGPRRVAADEDDPRRRRPPGLPRAGRSGGRAAVLPAGPLALHDRPHGRRVRRSRDLPVLRARSATSRTSRAARPSSARHS